MFIENYIRKLISLLENQFDSRLLYVGLQGSYLRGEENADSDIDIMVVIDDLSVSDLADYRLIVQSMDHYEKSCGFICSKTDLLYETQRALPPLRFSFWAPKHGGFRAEKTYFFIVKFNKK